MKKLTTILLLAALIPATSFADFETGNSLLARCANEGTEDVDYMERHRCSAYIVGISDAHGAFTGWKNMEPKFCSPKSVTVNQLKKITVKYMNDYPEALHFAAASLVSNALSGAFPASVKDDGTRYCPDEEQTK